MFFPRVPWLWMGVRTLIHCASTITVVREVVVDVGEHFHLHVWACAPIHSSAQYKYISGCSSGGITSSSCSGINSSSSSSSSYVLLWLIECT